MMLRVRVGVVAIAFVYGCSGTINGSGQSDEARIAGVWAFVQAATGGSGGASTENKAEAYFAFGSSREYREIARLSQTYGATTLSTIGPCARGSYTFTTMHMNVRAEFTTYPTTPPGGQEPPPVRETKDVLLDFEFVD